MVLAGSQAVTDALRPELAEHAAALAQGRARWWRTLTPDEQARYADMARAADALAAWAGQARTPKLQAALAAAADDPDKAAALARWWAVETALAVADRLANHGVDAFRADEARRAALQHRLDSRLRQIAHEALHGARRWWPEMAPPLQRDNAEMFMAFARERLERAWGPGALPRGWQAALPGDGEGGR